MRNHLRLLFGLFLLLAPLAARAHVGSKDVFEEVTAGPYKLYVTIRPPNVIPGVAVVEVRAIGAPVTAIEMTPLPMTGEGAKHAPTPDKMKVATADQAFFTGSSWMMVAGSWEIRFHIFGTAGERTVAVPIAAASLAVLRMNPALGALLAACGLILILGIAGIVGAAVGESHLDRTGKISPEQRRRSVAAIVVALGCISIVLWGGAHWWHVEAAVYSNDLYRPLSAQATLTGDTLDLHVGTFTASESFKSRSNNDFILDHGKIMHLYVIREPEMDQIYHLHPTLVAAGEFRLNLPNMPPGDYKLYGDVVHANGFPETLVSTLHVPAGMPGGPLVYDDASGSPAPVSAGELPNTYKLPDGYAMVWDKPATLTANSAYAFHFRLLDPAGQPPAHMHTYLGMAGHAAFVKTDGTVFAHVHPEGSAAMAALMLANNDGMGMGGGSMTAMPGMGDSAASADADLTSNAVEFPYGFPTAGRYRIFIQMKHDATVETGTFDAVVK